MILIRNQSGQYVELGPLRDASGAVITSGATAWINNATADGTLVHRGNGIWGYTFAQGETFGNTALRVQATGGSVCGNFAFLSSIDGLIVAHSVSNITDLGLKVRYIQDNNGNAHEIAQSGNDDSVYELDLNSITASIIYPTVGTVTATANASYISIRTNEAITVTVALYDAAGTAVSTVGMTLELVFESGSTEVVIANADITKSATGFSFTVPSTLNSSERLWTYTCRKTTDEAVLCIGKVEVIYAPNN